MPVTTLKDRCLSGTVWADEAADLAFMDREIQFSDGCQSAEIFGQFSCFQQHVGVVFFHRFCSTPMLQV